MEPSLRVLRAITTRLPRVRGAGRCAYAIKRWYLRQPRTKVEVPVLGFRMNLDPHDLIGGELLFVPQFYDWREISFLRNTLQPGDEFCDVGANIGFYSLVASQIVGSTGRVLAVEADPENFSDLSANVALSHAVNVESIHAGVSDRHETLRLQLNTTGNRGGHSFVDMGRTEGVDVECQPLADLLGEMTPTAMKLDIEGFEHKVMSAYFAETERTRWPRHILIERQQHFSLGDAEVLLTDGGYRPVLTTDMNRVYSLIS